MLQNGPFFWGAFVSIFFLGKLRTFTAEIRYFSQEVEPSSAAFVATKQDILKRNSGYFQRCLRCRNQIFFKGSRTTKQGGFKDISSLVFGNSTRLF